MTPAADWSTSLLLEIVQSPVGQLAVYSPDAATLCTEWLNDDATPETFLQASAVADKHTETASPERMLDEAFLHDVADRLRDYFAGRPAVFEDIATPAGSAFFRQCWEVCRNIPSGQTLSYADLAKLAGSAGAARAAGQAMRRNPLPVIVPCHRVIGAHGELHGYAGTTDQQADPLVRKRWLLDLEKHAGDASVNAQDLAEVCVP